MSQMNEWDGFSRPVRTRRRNLTGQPREASVIGEVISEYMTRSILPRQSCFAAVAGVWEDSVPAELRAHCELKDFSDRQLVVRVDSPVYLYELQLRHDELLREIQRRLRGLKRGKMGGEMDEKQMNRGQIIRRLKFTAG